MKDQVAGARGTQADPDLLIVGGRRDPVETVELGLPAACLAGALPGFIATDELLGPGDVVLLGVVLLLTQGPPLAAQAQVLAVIAGIPLARSGLQLENVVGRAFEKAAVVRDDQHAGAGEPKEFLQPFDGLQVEVVGWLVQQQQVRLLQEKACERQAAPLPAAEGARRQRLVCLGQANAVEHLGDLVVVGIAVQALVLVLDVTVVLDQGGQLCTLATGHRRFELTEPDAQTHDVGPAV